MAYTGSLGWTLATIRNKVRNLTGTSSADELTDNQINDYINNYYVYTMPFELKNQIQIAFIDFQTQAGIDTYPFPIEGNFLTNNPEAYADGIRMAYYQDPNVFFQDWPAIYNTDTPVVGNGGNTYPGTVTGPPIIIGTLIVGDTNGGQVAVDNGKGQFIQTLPLLIPPAVYTPSGSINYITGAFTVNFASPVATGLQIIAKYQNYVSTRPEAIMFFEQEFTLRPIPDTVYAIRLEGFINPSQITSDSGSPTQTEWGQCLAYGASWDILMDRGDPVGAAEIYQGLKRYETVALGRTTQQYLAERSRPRW